MNLSNTHFVFSSCWIFLFSELSTLLLHITSDVFLSVFQIVRLEACAKKVFGQWGSFRFYSAFSGLRRRFTFYQDKVTITVVTYAAHLTCCGEDAAQITRWPRPRMFTPLWLSPLLKTNIILQQKPDWCTKALYLKDMTVSLHTDWNYIYFYLLQSQFDGTVVVVERIKLNWHHTP